MSHWPICCVKVKKLRDTSRVPTYVTDGAAGADVYADFSHLVGGEPMRVSEFLSTPRVYAAPSGVPCALVLPGNTYAVPIGVALEIPIGWHGQLKARSGMAGRGNDAHVAAIDPDFRGEPHVIIHVTTPQVIHHGERIGQILFIPTGRGLFSEADELSETARDRGGFGHTGAA